MKWAYHLFWGSGDDKRIQPTFPSINDGNTAVLYDAISFYGLLSNLDCIELDWIEGSGG